MLVILLIVMRYMKKEENIFLHEDTRFNKFHGHQIVNVIKSNNRCSVL
jgi:hypothetical protein